MESYQWTVFSPKYTGQGCHSDWVHVTHGGSFILSHTLSQGASFGIPIFLIWVDCCKFLWRLDEVWEISSILLSGCIFISFLFLMDEKIYVKYSYFLTDNFILKRSIWRTKNIPWFLIYQTSNNIVLVRSSVITSF